MKPEKIATAIGLALALFAAPVGAAEKLTVALNWFPAGDHAAYWVALEKGYFAERSLDVTLQHSKGSGAALIKVDTGAADIGLSDAAVVTAARASGSTAQMIGIVFDKSPLNFFSRSDNPITKPANLVGKTVAAPPGDGQRQVWPAFATANGLDPDAITWINVEPSAKIGALAQGRVDAAAHFTTGLPYYQKALGEDQVVMMPWSDFGFEMYSLAFIAKQETIDERPDVLRKFLEAAYMGWRDVMSDPDAAMEIFKKRVPEIDVADLKANMMIGLDLMRTEAFAENGIGWMDESRVCHTVDLVNTYMDLSEQVNCQAVYTNKLHTKVTPPEGFSR